MTVKKRILTTIISLTAVISIIMGGVFCSADEVDFGTPEDGLYQIGKRWWVARHPAYKGGEGMPNGDFQQGYKYWAQNHGKKCSDVSSIKEEDGNKYLHFNGEQCQSNYEGIMSVRFAVKGVQPGTPVALLYKWRGDTQFQVFLCQWVMSADEQTGTEIRVSSSIYTKVVYEAFEEGEWNIGVTSAADGTNAIVLPDKGSDEYFFTIGIEITTDVSAVFDIDDIQMVIRQNNGIITDLNGKQLYDLNNLDMKAVEETDMDFSDFDFDSKEVEMPDPSGMTPGVMLKNQIIDKDSSIQNEKSDSVFDSLTDTSKPLFWVVVAVGVIIIAGSAVAIILLIKKRNKAQPSDEIVGFVETDVSADAEEDIQ